MNQRRIANKLERAACKYGSFHDCEAITEAFSRLQKIHFG